MYRAHKLEKKQKYNARVINIERATFTPLVFSTSGGMGPEASVFYKRVAEKIANKSSQRYSDIISFIRRRLRFDLLKTCLISLRGFRGKKSTVVASSVDDVDLNLIHWWCLMKLSDPSGKFVNCYEIMILTLENLTSCLSYFELTFVIYTYIMRTFWKIACLDSGLHL